MKRNRVFIAVLTSWQHLLSWLTGLVVVGLSVVYALVVLIPLLLVSLLFPPPDPHDYE